MQSHEPVPMELLLLADPSLGRNLHSSWGLFVAEVNGDVVGEYVLIETRPETVELVNVAVRESEHGQGLGKQRVHMRFKPRAVGDIGPLS